ncbi:biotin--[acetyl-CoA-carboxylase] ligase [Halobacteriovorax sp. ZH5_bin.2]|uniref:biotin--[acetyl-CoA-carboxylase] ligase n=1 Tax=unclassified Halobacteriovorax TaxID=2639665 RepID=UPI0037130F14
MRKSMKHLHFEEIPSTQTIAIEEAHHYDQLLVSAKLQTSARGRRLNKWEDLQDSLCFSCKLEAQEKPTLLALEVAVMLSNYFNEHKLLLKWPNDIFNVDSQKIMGILVNKDDDNYIVGIGINYGGLPHETYGVLKPGNKLRDIDYKELPLKIYDYFLNNRLTEEETINQWNERCYHLNKEVKIVDEDSVIEGIFKGIGSFGEALIEVQGKIEKAYTGSLIIK